MINDAQIGDAPAMVDDAKLDAGGWPMVVEAPAEAEEAASEEVEETPSEEESESEPEPDQEAEGRAAAQAGEERSNPYDGRTAKGKAWFRGYDSVSD